MSALERIVKEAKFNKISLFHTLIPIPLVIFILAMIKYINIFVERVMTGKPYGEIDITTTSLLGFYIVYLIGAAASIYILYSKLIDHVIYSSMTLYYWSKHHDIDFKIVFRCAVEKKKIPSPTTALLLTLLSMGIAYPILLWLFEKAIRDHAVLEEDALFKERFTSSIDVGYLLLSLGLTVLSFGAYLTFWIYRAIRVFNKHIMLIHKSHPSAPTRESVITTILIPEHYGVSPIYILGTIVIVLLSMVVFTILSFLNKTIYPLFVLGYSFIFAYIAWSLRKMPIVTQSFLVLALEYFFITVSALIGYSSYNLYSNVLESFRKSIEVLTGSGDLYIISSNIFLNNVKILIGGLIPVLGQSLVGYAVSNTGFILGLLMGFAGGVKGFSMLIALFTMPHSPLELYAYALAASISTKIGMYSEKKLALYSVIALLILLLAAYVEAYLIIYK